MTNYARSSRFIAPSKKTQDKERTKNLSILIPAASIGYRMKRYGAKGLLELPDGIPLLEKQLMVLWGLYPKAEIIVTVGFQASRFYSEFRQKYPVRFVLNDKYEDTNVLYSLGLALQASICRNVLIVYGDLVFNAQAIKGITKGGSSVVTKSSGKASKEEVGVITDDNMATNFSYGVPNTWQQIAFLTGKELGLFEDVAFDTEKCRWYGHEAMNHILDKGGKLETFECMDGDITEIDSIKDMENIK
jgi:CTP:phosphocholine cytidylyltransferase-like protein